MGIGQCILCIIPTFILYLCVYRDLKEYIHLIALSVHVLLKINYKFT